MQDLQTFDISDFPGLASIKRKAVVTGRNEDYENRRVTLLVRVEHYTEAGVRLNNMQAIEAQPFLLVATDDTQVNPETGAIVQLDEAGNYPAGSISEYDFLKLAVENGANPFTLVEGAVLQADALKRFD